MGLYGNLLRSNKNIKVFLGGTCNGSKLRERLIPLLKIDYFNPVVEDWTEECYQEELKQREICDICLYMISPKMTGVYSIAEVVDDSNKRPERTVFYYSEKDELDSFDKGQIKSLEKVGQMVQNNGGLFVKGSIEQLANILNNFKFIK